MNRLFLPFVLLALLAGCSADTLTRRLTPAAEFGRISASGLAGMKAASPYLKAHMKDGSVYVFSDWGTNGYGTPLDGPAVLLGPMRDTVCEGPVSLAVDSVVLFETNMIGQSGATGSLTLLTGISAAATIHCIVNPKACFGSCPTFYVTDGESLRLQAEGFSSSISPSMEATDIDALYRAHPAGSGVAVEMRNEALETHVVRAVNLLALPRRSGERIFAGIDGRFHPSPRRIAPLSALAPEGDCLPALAEAEGMERISLADSAYLGAKETIELEFRMEPGREYGLALSCRQALLPTYLLYQALAYMGNDAGHWLAEIERGRLGGAGSTLERLIGGIDVEVKSADGTWRAAGALNEHGPLARDMHLIPIGVIPDGAVSVRLRMTKGAWRLDYAALAELSAPRDPVRLSPERVAREGRDDAAALDALLDPAQTLVTQPGDVYTMHYTLPESDDEFELFLESRGYYFEWMRQEWIAEENPAYLAQMFIDPDGALRRMAPAYKRVESSMEDCFWGSRYAKP